MSGGVCETCPLSASLCAAEALATNEASHLNRGSTLGGIALTRRALEAVANELNCEDPIHNSNGQLTCRLSDVALQTRTFAFHLWPQSQFNVQLDRQQTAPEATLDTTPNTGQYL